MAKNPDYSRSAGGAALAARLRRLSERIDREGSKIYAAMEIQFEQRWYGVLNQLFLNGPMSVGELAEALCITHVSVSQTSRSLEAAGIITSSPAPRDARRRELRVTPKGQALVEQLAPIWSALNTVAEDLNAEAGNVVLLLDRLEDALTARSLFDRTKERMGAAFKTVS